jgi:hypothetical protein
LCYGAGMAEDSQPASVTLSCPHCTESIECVLVHQPQIANCPYCNGAFMLPSADGGTLPLARAGGEGGFIIDDTAEAELRRMQRDDGELDGIKIRQIAAGKRAANRSRSYCLIITVAAIVGAIQLAWNAVHGFREYGYNNWSMAYILTVPVCLLLAVRFYRRSEFYRREAAESSLKDPKRPPDLDSLSDGSQHWKNLGGM